MGADENGREFGNGDQGDMEELQRILRELLQGDGTNMPTGIDPQMFAKMSGLPGDPATLQNLFATMQNAMQQPSDTIDWSITRKSALEIAASRPDTTSPTEVNRAFPVAALWLDEITDVGQAPDAPRALTSIEWVQQTVDTWISMAEPVAHSISQTLTDSLTGHLPEELSASIGQFTPMFRSVGGALFATQLGQIVGKLSLEVRAGGDIGMPLFSGTGKEGGVLLPHAVAQFAEGLDQDEAAVTLYLAVRELAHARLFRHTKWLRLHLLTAIADYSRGVRIDTAHIENLTESFDPTDTEQIQNLLSSGALIPPKTPEQIAAHERLETMLALVEGWVDAVTDAAVSRLPGSQGIAEMVRRSRAVGGPAESAFSNLVGLELRPRRLREAASLWRLVSEHGGSAARDGLWAHPDLLPTSEEIDQPQLLLERIGLTPATDQNREADEFEIGLAQLLDGTLPQATDQGDADDHPDGSESQDPLR